MPTACVIDDMLYYYSVYDFTKKIKTYDPKRRCWEVVKGLRKLFSKMKNLQCIHAANYGGKLALFYTSKEDYRRGRGVKSKREIWCADISLERRQGGEIWGKVEWCGQVLVADLWVKNCLNVMV
ncbi:F-box/kelch-repeat protein [Raphanus sativus]|nr:F-box/kelch-repeat protein [Raphanus sativus]